MTDVSTYFNQVYEATFRTLMRACVCKARRLADADDLLQNTYARFYRYIQKHGVGSVQNRKATFWEFCRRSLSPIIGFCHGAVRLRWMRLRNYPIRMNLLNPAVSMLLQSTRCGNRFDVNRN